MSCDIRPPALTSRQMFINFVIAALTAYLLGAIPSGVIIARAFRRVDVRDVGSGHTGALNTLRAAGLGAGAFTLLADAGKAIVAVEFAHVTTDSEWGMALAGIVVVIGHILPVYTRFHGGMGLSTGIGALLVLAPALLVALVLAWFPLRFVLKRSARASMAVALGLPLLLAWTRADAPSMAFGVGVGAVLFVRHLGAWNR